MSRITILTTILTFLGGLGLFLFGVQLTSVGLQKFAASRLKRILQSITKRNFIAVLFGMILTVAFQSSVATTVLTVEFVNTGMMSLTQALGIVLGSAVGTSVTIQLLAFKMLPVALGLIFVGFLLYFIRDNHRWKYIGQGLIGFGIIFVGMANMQDASAPLSKIPQVYAIMGHLSTHPHAAVLTGIILTALIQSSTAVFAIMMSLAANGVLPLSAMIPLVLGAHIGGTVTTLFSGITAQKMDAKRVAIANTAYKAVGTAVVWPFLPQLTDLIQWMSADVQRQVANAHLVFALFMVVLFLPLNTLLAKALIRFLPLRSKIDKQLKFHYIEVSSLEVPAVALKQARQEMTAMGEMIFNKMLLNLPKVIMNPSDELFRQVDSAEKEADWLYRHITRFLLDLSKQELTEEQLEENISTQFILKELEFVGDIIVSTVKLTQRFEEIEHRVTAQQWDEISRLYEKVRENFASLITSLQSGDEKGAGYVIRKHPEILRMKYSLQFSILATSDNLKNAAAEGETGWARKSGNTEDSMGEEKQRSLAVDIINLFYNIDQHTRNMAEVIIGIK